MTAIIALAGMLAGAAISGYAVGREARCEADKRRHPASRITTYRVGSEPGRWI